MRGWSLLALCLAAFLPGCTKKLPPKPQPKEEIPVEVPKPPKFGGQSVRDTGAIMFVCNGGAGKHEEKEVLVSVCPNCSKTDYFCYFENAFYCYSCEKQYPTEQLKCGECGFVPKKTRIKHR